MKEDPEVTEGPVECQPGVCEREGLSLEQALVRSPTLEQVLVRGRNTFPDDLLTQPHVQHAIAMSSY